MLMRTAHLPQRIITGAYILHSGLQKRNADEETAKWLHDTAAKAYPILRDVPPRQFARLLSIAEIAIGTALLVPLVPSKLAGAKLTAFAAGLVGLYARLPGMRQPGSIWPSEQGIGLAKDVFLLAIGLSLFMDRNNGRKKVARNRLGRRR